MKYIDTTEGPVSELDARAELVEAVGRTCRAVLEAVAAATRFVKSSDPLHSADELARLADTASANVRGLVGRVKFLETVRAQPERG